MAEYIEREKAQDGLDNIDWYHVNDKGQLLPGGKTDIETYVPFKAVEEMLTSIPAADVWPVVRGRWIETKTGFHCSACKTKAKGTKNGALLSNFCPNCGAMMEES